MTPDDYARAGLTKLSDEERRALDDWLARYESGELETARTQAVVEAVEEARSRIWQMQAAERIEAKILGEFTGWSGQTVFRLDNGQVWRQRLPGRYRYDGPPNPVVEVSLNKMGFFVLAIKGSSRRTGVERIK